MELRFKVFEHAAALIGRSPWEVSRDAELLFQAQAAAYRLYRQQPLITAIDHYNLAPEAYGGVVARPEGHGVPAIPQPALPEADRALALARARPNTVIGAGVLPYETQSTNVFRLRDYLASASDSN